MINRLIRNELRMTLTDNSNIRNNRHGIFFIEKLLFYIYLKCGNVVIGNDFESRHEWTIISVAGRISRT